MRKSIYHKYLLFSLLLVVAMLLISSCKQNTENYNIVNQNNPETAIQNTENPVTEPAEPTEQLNFDPLAEEVMGDLIEEPVDIDISNAELPSVPEISTLNTEQNNYESAIEGNIKYAGATPIPILPIDIPTPTPKAALQFNYEEYTVQKLNLKFQAPAGWEIDESMQDTFILNEPLTNQKDNFSASIVIRALPLSKEYSSSDLNRELKSQLEQMGLLNYTRWSPSNVAKRSLLNKDGLYANYKGTLVNGTKIRGRLHMVAIGNTLYSVQITHPADYNEDFIGVHSKIRHTIAFINTQQE